MKKLTTSTGVYGPFESVEILADRYRAGSVELPFSVVGSDGVIEDAVPGEFDPPPPDPQAELEAWRESAWVTPLEGLLAIDQLGMAAAFEVWATAPERTFAERAFLDKATTWKRNDPVMVAGATELGLTAEQLDQVFKAIIDAR